MDDPLHKDNFLTYVFIKETFLSILRVVFSTLSNIYARAFSRKQLTAKNRYFSAKCSIIDVQMGPECIS